MTHTPTLGLETISQLIQTIHRLRAPGGCPWDRKQTHLSLRPYLIEESYEVIDVIDQIKSPEDLKTEKIRKAFCEELGDVLMQVLIHSEMANETAAFNIYHVAKGLNEKLIRRHPHVFGDIKADSAESAVERWEKEKAKEKASQLDASILDGVPKGLPALQRAARVIEKVTRVGFQWDDMNGPLQKVEEELNELKTEVLAYEKTQDLDPKKQDLRSKVEGELGDLFFTLCNVAYLMKISPEDSLRSTLTRFESRFKHVERGIKAQGKTLEESNLQEMDRFWDEAKKLEKVQIWGLTGGIAAGKSTAGRFFSELGIPVLDADLIAKELTEKNEKARAAILEKLGTLDRTELRNLVFSDSQARQDLESILHPLIRTESLRQIQILSEKHPIVIYEASLLIETGRSKDMTGVIVVEAPQEVRLKRLLLREGMTAPLAERILNSQMKDQEREKYANVTLQNTQGLEELQTQIRAFVKTRGWA